MNEHDRIEMIERTLEAAAIVGDSAAMNACRRLIAANRRGWDKHHDPADFQIVLAHNPAC